MRLNKLDTLFNAIKSHKWIYAFVFASLNFSLAYILSKYILNTDDFLNHAIAHQITKGEHLYTSITILLPPLNFYLMAGLRFLPFEPEFSYRLGVGIISCLSAGTMYFILKNTIGEHLAKRLIWLTLFSHFLLIPTIWYGNNAALCVIASIYFLTKKNSSTADNVLASAMIALALFFKQNIGIPALLALCIIGFVDGIKLQLIRIAALTLVSLLILFCLATLSHVSVLEYGQLFWDHNVTLVQNGSTRSLTITHVLFNILGGWVDFSSPYYDYFLSAYILALVLLLAAVRLDRKYGKQIYLTAWFSCTIFATSFIVLSRLHSHHAFFNVLFVSISCATIVLLFMQIKQQSLSLKYLTPLIVSGASLTGALLKGPWGIVEVYNIFFVITAILLSLAIRCKQKTLTYILSLIFVQISIYNFAVFYRDFSSINWEKFETVDLPNIKGFEFYNNAQTYNGLRGAYQWIKDRPPRTSYFVFPPEVPLHLIADDVNKTGIINTSKNILPYPLETTILSLDTYKPDVIFWKLEHMQVEANSYFSSSEKRMFYEWISKHYQIVDRIQNYLIFGRQT